MIILYKPKIFDLWFRRSFLEDEATMSFNHAWGGTISFPKSDWTDWYNHWIINHDGKRFYRYLMEVDTDEFVGEIAYHFDGARQIWLVDVIIPAQFRGNGYGTKGLRILCEEAAKNGIDEICDDIAIDNPAITLFLREGFVEEYRTNDIIMLRKKLAKTNK